MDKKAKARRTDFGLSSRAPQASGSSKSNCPFFYYGFRQFARSEAYLFCCYARFVVVGVAWFSVFVGVVGEDRATAVMNAVLLESAMHTDRPKDDTVKPPKGKRPTVKLKIAAGMA